MVYSILTSRFNPPRLGAMPPSPRQAQTRIKLNHLNKHFCPGFPRPMTDQPTETQKDHRRKTVFENLVLLIIQQLHNPRRIHYCPYKKQ